MREEPANALLLAVHDDKLEKFVVGEPPYFHEAKTDNPEPQNVVAAFDQLVLRYWMESRDPGFPERLVAAFTKALEICPDQNRAIYVLSDWVWYYSYCLNKKYADPKGRYSQLFEVDLEGVARLLKEQMVSNKLALMSDTRWAGARWNGSSGLWEPLIRTALNVRDELHGPDFVPC